MIQLAYTPKPNPVKLDFVFYDKEGVRWFEAKEMPIDRKLRIAHSFTKLWSGISEIEINKSALAIQDALNEQVGGKQRPNIARIGYICKHLLSRAGFSIHLESLYELAAMYYVRDGERAELVDMDLLPAKIELLKGIDISEFFFSQNLETLFPFLQDFEGTMYEAAQVAKVESETYLTELEKWQTK